MCSGWHPISTAPMGSRHIDVWQVLRENGKSDGVGVRVTDVRWSISDKAFVDTQGRLVEVVKSDWALILTHWRERPDAPDASGDKSSTRAVSAPPDMTPATNMQTDAIKLELDDLDRKWSSLRSQDGGGGSPWIIWERMGELAYELNRRKNTQAPEGLNMENAPDMSATVADYEEVLADHRRLVRELDVALHGEAGAAEQASLCDLIEPARQLRRKCEARARTIGMLRAQLRMVGQIPCVIEDEATGLAENAMHAVARRHGH